MYNLRYHIASLVGVFLALALGLVLGGIVVERGAVERQQGALIKGLENEYSDLRAENRGLAEENQLMKAYATLITDGWSADRLKGRTVLVLTNAGRESGSSDVVKAIESAGGAVATVVITKAGLGLDDDATRAAVASLAGDPDRPLESIAASLVAEWTAPNGERPLTEALVEAEVISVDGLRERVMVTGLVDVARDDGDADAAGIALAKAFSDVGPSVAAQLATEDTGVATAARAAGVPAFDTLGSDVGRYTLIALLTGASPGYYGTGAGALALFPTP